METAIKTAEFDLLAANYNDMFQGLIKGVEQLHASNPNALSWTQFKTPESFKTACNSEISWAKQHLKKQDRIVWWLRWARAVLAYTVFGSNTSEPFQPYKEKFVDPILEQMEKVHGQPVEKYNILHGSYGATFDSLHEKLDHYLALPIPAIQNLQFGKQAPYDLLEQFKQEEKAWRGATKGLLTPYEGDEIVVQFADGWAWWKLGRGYCPEEAKAMGHCGNVAGKYNTNERILSLRRPVRFGTETRWEPHLTFILDGDGWLGEMKGRGNERPAERYHPYIVALLEASNVVKGVKGGGYLPSHNFSPDDLDYADQERLQKLNPNLVSAGKRLQQLGGRPDNDLIIRISKALGKSTSGYNHDVDGWVLESWDTPGIFIDTESSTPGLREAYAIYKGEDDENANTYGGNQNIRKTIMALQAGDLAVIFEWLSQRGMDAALDEIAKRHVLAPKGRMVLLDFCTAQYNQGTDAAQARQEVRTKLYDAWKAGITPEMRERLGEEIKNAVEGSYYRNGDIVVTGDDFWNDEVSQVMPIRVAAARADGTNREEDEDGYNPDYEEGLEMDFNTRDPYITAYGRVRLQFEKWVKKNLDADEQVRASEMTDEFYKGNTLPLINAVKEAIPGAFDDVKGAWDVDKVRHAIHAEFAQGSFAFGPSEPTSTTQHASLLLQKDASFYLIAANYEEMFKSLLAIDQYHAQTIKDEITWAKQHLKKQDRIVWWLRWFRLSLLAEAMHRKQMFTQTLEKQTVKQPDDEPRRAKAQQEYDALHKYFDGELKTLTARTGQPVHGGYPMSWWKRIRPDVDHFLSLPVNKIQTAVWDKQSPEGLFEELRSFEKEWQDQTKGLVRPNLTPSEAVRPEVQSLQEKFDDLRRELEALGAKKDKGEVVYEKRDEQGVIVAQSTRPQKGYTKRVITPQEIQQSITETQLELAEVEKKFNEANAPEVDTVFLQFQDGWAWWKLSRAYCSEEARAMGHCGNVVGQDRPDERILSLRKPVKVGTETYWEPHLTFIMEPNGFLGEMKGKGNQKPTQQYHKYIISLLEDPRVKGIRGGGYLPAHNFSMKDLPPEVQESIQQKNPNMMAFTRQLKEKGATQELLKSIGELLWPPEEGAVQPYDPKVGGWVTEKWKDVDALVEEKGNQTAKWISKQMSGNMDDYYDYSEGASIGDAISNMNSKQDNMLRQYLELTYPEEIEQWKEAEIANGEEDPVFAGADLADFIHTYDIGDVESSLMRALDTGYRYGAEHEMYKALLSAVMEFSIEGTGETLKLPMYERKVKKRLNNGKVVELPEQGLTWDSPVYSYLTIQGAAELADKGEPFQYYEDENIRAASEIEVSEHSDWSAWDDEAFGNELDEEFGHPETPEEAAKKQKDMEREAKKRPDLIAVRENGKIKGWRQNPDYKGPKLGPGGVLWDEKTNAPLKQKRAPKEKRKKKSALTLPRFLYHVTSKANLDSIRRDGLQTKFYGVVHGQMDVHPPKPAIYLSRKPESDNLNTELFKQAPLVVLKIDFSQLDQGELWPDDFIYPQFTEEEILINEAEVADALHVSPRDARKIFVKLEGGTEQTLPVLMKPFWRWYLTQPNGGEVAYTKDIPASAIVDVKPYEA